MSNRAKKILELHPEYKTIKELLDSLILDIKEKYPDQKSVFVSFEDYQLIYNEVFKEEGEVPPTLHTLKYRGIELYTSYKDERLSLLPLLGNRESLKKVKFYE